MTNKTSMQKGYYSKILVLDCETTGIMVNQDDPSYDPTSKKTHQALSWGLIVADAETYKPIDELYLEIQWNGKSEWTNQAEKIHGLSKEHLLKHGKTEEEAAIVIAEFIDKYWPQDAVLSANRNVRCMGHNVATFDIHFMRRLLRQFHIMFPTGNRYIDSASVAAVLLKAYSSDMMFDQLGLGNRTIHNALEDCRLTLEAMKRMRAIFNLALKGINQ